MSVINNSPIQRGPNSMAPNYIDRAINVVVNYPTLVLGTQRVAVTVPGVQVNDHVLYNVNRSSALTLGVVIVACRVSAANTVELTIGSVLALGVAAGSVSLDFLITGNR